MPMESIHSAPMLMLSLAYPGSCMGGSHSFPLLLRLGLHFPYNLVESIRGLADIQTLFTSGLELPRLFSSLPSVRCSNFCHGCTRYCLDHAVAFGLGYMPTLFFSSFFGGGMLRGRERQGKVWDLLLLFNG
jgi:hypothetical protein